MVKKKNNKKQELGIYYTPEVVVEFIFNILKTLKNKEDKETHRWQSRKPWAHFPAVIDPACGEGIFLKKAVESGFTGYHPKYRVPYIFGVDLDKSVVEKWEEISILGLFHGNRQAMRTHFYHQNGLENLPPRVLLYKTGGLRKYDAVVGNPPYGGIGVDISKEEHISLYNALRQFEIYHYRGKRGEKRASQMALVGDAVVGVSAIGKGSDISVKEATSVSIEILFIERFLQLCRPGGWIAIIIPDGILANSTYNYVRRFIAERTKILAIVSLPRKTFKQVGTTAKTSILFLQKARDKLLRDPKAWDYPVFLATINKVEKESFDIMVREFRSFIEKGILING